MFLLYKRSQQYSYILHKGNSKKVDTLDSNVKNLFSVIKLT